MCHVDVSLWSSLAQLDRAVWKNLSLAYLGAPAGYILTEVQTAREVSGRAPSPGAPKETVRLACHKDPDDKLFSGKILGSLKERRFG